MNWTASRETGGFPEAHQLSSSMESPRRNEMHTYDDGNNPQRIQMSLESVLRRTIQTISTELEPKHDNQVPPQHADLH